MACLETIIRNMYLKEDHMSGKTVIVMGKKGVVANKTGSDGDTSDDEIYNIRFEDGTISNYPVRDMQMIGESVEQLDEAKEMTFVFPDDRKAKQFDLDIENSGIGMGNRIGNKVTVTNVDTKWRAAIKKAMLKSKGKLIKESYQLDESLVLASDNLNVVKKTAEKLSKQSPDLTYYVVKHNERYMKGMKYAYYEVYQSVDMHLVRGKVKKIAGYGAKVDMRESVRREEDDRGHDDNSQSTANILRAKRKAAKKAKEKTESVELDEAKSPVKSLGKEAKAVLAMAINMSLTDTYRKDSGPVAHDKNLEFFGDTEIDAAIKFLDKNSKKLTPAGRQAAKEIVKTLGESVELDEAFDMKKMLKIFNKLKKNDTIKIKYDSSISRGKEFQTFVVTSPKRPVGKKGVERVIMKHVDNPTGVKYTLYNRDGSVSLAIGDMAASMTDIKESADHVEHDLDEASRPMQFPGAMSGGKMKGKFTSAQLKQLKDAYAKIGRVDPSSKTYEKLTAFLDAQDKNVLQQLANARIQFISSLALNRVNRLKMKGS